jgi:hypothetical protein
VYRCLARCKISGDWSSYERYARLTARTHIARWAWSGRAIQKCSMYGNRAVVVYTNREAKRSFARFSIGGSSSFSGDGGVPAGL